MEVAKNTETTRTHAHLFRVARTVGLAFGIVVVLGKGSRGEVPEPMPGVSEAPIETAATEPGGPTPAATVDQSDATPTPAKKEKSPWRGSTIAYRNAVTAITIDRSAELTYNPFWGMALELAPRYAFDDVWSLAASLEIAREITEADDTTFADETLLGDLGLRLSAARFATIPGAKIDISAGLGLGLPTSKASQGDTLMFSLSPSLRLSRSFEDVLEGLSLGYTLGFTKLFHRYTTGELASPAIAGCTSFDLGSCDRFLNTGYRNASFRLSNGFDVGLDMTSWLSASASFAIIVSWLHDDVEDERVSNVTLEPTDERYALAADLGVSATWWKPLEVRLGASTINPQLRPDGGRYAPFFNRFTTLYLDLRLDVAALVQDLTSP